MAAPENNGVPISSDFHQAWPTQPTIVLSSPQTQAVVFRAAKEAIREAFQCPGFPASYGYVPAAPDLTVAKAEFGCLPLPLYVQA